MPAHDQPQRVHVGQRVDQPDIAFAWHAEDLIDVVGFQAFGKQAGNGTGHFADVSWFLVQRPGQRTSGYGKSLQPGKLISLSLRRRTRRMSGLVQPNPWSGVVLGVSPKGPDEASWTGGAKRNSTPSPVIRAVSTRRCT